MADEPKDLQIKLSDQAQAAIDADPQLADVMKSFQAALHQANAAVQAGQYPDIKTAMAALGFQSCAIELDAYEDEDDLDNDNGAS